MSRGGRTSKEVNLNDNSILDENKSAPKKNMKGGVTGDKGIKIDDKRLKKPAPVKKIPNVHVDSEFIDFKDATTLSKQVSFEKQKNEALQGGCNLMSEHSTYIKHFQLEIERLRKCLDICRKTINEKNDEIELLKSQRGP